MCSATRLSKAIECDHVAAFGTEALDAIRHGATQLSTCDGDCLIGRYFASRVPPIDSTGGSDLRVQTVLSWALHR